MRTHEFLQSTLAGQHAEAAPGKPDDLARRIRDEFAKWGHAVRDAGEGFA